MSRGLDFATHACKAGGWKCGQYRDKARWGGRNTCHCTVCGELFARSQASDTHTTLDSNGDVVCRDPATLVRRNGDPVFEKIPKPMWDPPHVWRLVPHHRWAENLLDVKRQTPPTVVPGDRGSADAQARSNPDAAPPGEAAS